MGGSKDIESSAVHFYSVVTSSKNVMGFYHLAALIRKYHQLWKKYLLDPTEGIPAPLQQIAEDKILCFCLTALEIQGIINLDPSKPFINAEPKADWKFRFNPEITPECKEKMLESWNSLGRPYLGWGINMQEYERFVSSRRIEEPTLFYPQDCDMLFDQIHSILLWDIRVPIEETIYEHDGPPKCCLEIDFRKISYETSLAIAFEPTDMDTLECIRELFPQYPEMVPAIIQDYYVWALPRRPEPIKDDLIFNNMKRDKGLDALRKVHSEGVYGCEYSISYKTDLFTKVPLFHRGALRQINEHPELFVELEWDCEMYYIKRNLVEPILEAKYGIRDLMRMRHCRSSRRRRFSSSLPPPY